MPGELPKILLGLLVGFGLLAWLTFATGSCDRQRVGKQEQVAQQKKGEADVHAREAQQADAASGRDAQQVAQVDARRVQLEAELAQLKYKLASRPKPAPAPAVADVVPELPARADGDDGQRLIAKQAELIQTQKQEITALQMQVIDLTAARDQWQGAFKAERDRAISLQLALDAQKAATKSGRWLGRFEGFAVGIGSGYIAGRLK